MRITGGEWVRRKVQGPRRGDDLRPTPDILREQAFAVLGPHLEGATFLDLFAGTGVNALEALSRRARRAVLVERERRAIDIIQTNLTLLDAHALVDIVALAAEDALARLAREGARFPVGWCDPPFAAWEQGTAALALARERAVLPAGALVVLEVPPNTPVAIAGFEVVRPLRGAVLLRAC